MLVKNADFWAPSYLLGSEHGVEPKNVRMVRAVQVVPVGLITFGSTVNKQPPDVVPPWCQLAACTNGPGTASQTQPWFEVRKHTSG